MNGDPTWLNVAAFQRLAGIKERAAREALSKCYGSHEATWRGVHLNVRIVSGVGGASGKTYQVDALSLPPDLAQKHLATMAETHTAPLIPLSSPAAGIEAIDHKQATNPRLMKHIQLANWKRELISEALRCGRYSRERTTCLNALIARNPHMRPDGATVNLKMQTLKQWIHDFEQGGFQGLVRKPRKEDKPRRIVSAAYDKASPLPDDVKREIWTKIEEEIKAQLVGSIAPLEQVRLLANAALVELSRQHGWAEASLENCDVGIGQVRKLKHLRTVAIRSMDNTRFRDAFVPRVVRNRLGYQPMDVVMGDVHPVDILKAREDGVEVDGQFLPNGCFNLIDFREGKEETATARMISWYDVATGRYCADYILLGKRQGVNQAMVVASFVAMTLKWGFPRRVYIDNGPEFKWGPFIEGLQRLSRLTAGAKDLIAEVLDPTEISQIISEANGEATDAEPAGLVGGEAIIRSRPHNPQSKGHKEGLYGVLERTVFCMVPGWIGGDRMNKKTHKVGKAPQAFDGTWRQFLAAMDACSKYYHNRKQKNGKSPNQRFEQFVADGWQATRVSYPALLMAFSEEQAVHVRNRGVQIGINRYWHDSMASPEAMGQRLRAWFAKWDPEQIIIDVAGQLLVARKDGELALLDRAGAREQNRRAQLLNQQLSAIKRGLPPVDMLARIDRFNAIAGPAPVVPFGPTVSLSPECQALDEALVDIAEPPQVKEITLIAGQYIDDDGAVRSDLEDILPPNPDEDEFPGQDALEILGSDPNWRPPSWEDDDQENARSSSAA